MLFTALLALAAAPQASPAAHPTAACPATPAPLPAGMTGWARPVAATGGASAAKASPLRIGTAVDAALLPTPRITYATPPEKPGDATSSGGVFAFTVTAPGRYRVALGGGAWVDVLRGTAAITSVAHGHGPACSTMRKMVDFDLKPGRYLLQVAGSAAAKLPLMVARLP